MPTPTVQAFFPLAPPAGATPADKELSERIDRLIRALSHEEFDERERATEELIEIGAPALAKIRPLLDVGGGETCYRAHRVFQGIRGFGPETEERVLELVRDLKRDVAPPPEAMEKILEAGTGAVAFALDRLSRAGGDRADRYREELIVRRALRDFARGVAWGSPDSLRGIGRRGRELVADIAADRGRENSERIFALNSLRQLSSGAAKETAVRLLRDPATPVRRAAVLHLAELASTEDFSRIAENEPAAPGSSALESRFLTGRLARSMKLTELRDLLGSSNVSVRAAAAWALGIRGDDDARDELRAKLEDDAALVRIEAARALGAIGKEEDIALLGRRLAEEKEVEVLLACLEGLSACGDKAVPWVASAMRDAESDVRRRAAVLLGRMGAVRALHTLIASVGDEDPAVEAAVLRAADRLAAVPLPAMLGVGTKEERENAAKELRKWWASQRKEMGEEERLLGQLASDAERILERIHDLLGEHFLSVREEKSSSRGAEEREKADRPREVRSETLKSVALDTVRSLVNSEKAPLSEELRGPLRTLLARASFRDLPDVGSFLAALPLPWDRESYVVLMNRVAKELVASLGDPFSRILMSHDPEGRFTEEIIPLLFGGAKTTGVILRRSGKDVVVDFVLSGSPAFRAGLRFGDRVVMIDGESPEEMTREELREVASREASLLVFRQGWARPFPFDLKPEEVFSQEPVRHAVLPGKIGYVWLQYFGQGTDTKVEWALRELEKEGIQGLVFDLRNNPGGLVVACTNIIDKFLGEDRKITTMVPRAGEEGKTEIFSSKSETDREYPVVILVNRSSASASELMSGSLQDLDRAVVVGERSYGKGVGQQGFMVPGFSGTSLLGDAETFYLLSLTTVRYFFPSGGNPHGIGVSPDREVPPRTATGERFTRLYRLERSKKLGEYVEKLAQSPLASALARWDGREASRYPDFDSFYESLRMPPSRPDVRRVVRRALRSELAARVTDAAVSLVDVAEDRVLRAGLEEVGAKIGLDDLDEAIEKEWGSPLPEELAVPAGAPESEEDEGTEGESDPEEVSPESGGGESEEDELQAEGGSRA